MTFVEGPLVREIRKGWRGNGGRYSLYQLKRRHNLSTNEVYCVLALPRQAAAHKIKNGWKVYCYHEDHPSVNAD